ncbi:MAG: hypothetical protein PT959_00770 [Firmicutes bacterium]|nr:hypothetical protein [Bacillota bacterium]
MIDFVYNRYIGCTTAKAGEMMLPKTYLWIEDRIEKSSYKFWTTFMHEVCPEVIVESKMNNWELVKSVSGLRDEDNRYIIALDNSFDNVQVCMEQKILKEAADKRNNVLLLNLICFEYTLLEFDELIDWIYAPEDEFRDKRAGAIAARKKLVQIIRSGKMNYKAIQEIIDYDINLDNHNIEQLSAKLLFDLTRNTGFIVSKSDLGECWQQNCCEWTRRQEDDICGLDHTKLTLNQKMKHIYLGTSLQNEFKNVGLGALI